MWESQINLLDVSAAVKISNKKKNLPQFSHVFGQKLDLKYQIFVSLIADIYEKGLWNSIWNKSMVFYNWILKLALSNSFFFSINICPKLAKTFCHVIIQLRDKFWGEFIWHGRFITWPNSNAQFSHLNFGNFQGPLGRIFG